MFTLLTLADQVAAAPLAAADGGFLDWISQKNAEAQVSVRAVAITIATCFVIWQAISSRLALARIIVAGLAAGVLVWVVFNVTELGDRVDSEVNSSAPVHAASPHGI